MDKLLDGTPHGVHTHVCGYEPRPTQETFGMKGCGWEWEHDGKDTGRQFGNGKEPSAAYRELHLCPNCGEGSWYSVKKGTHPQAAEQRKRLIERHPTSLAILLAAIVLASDHPGLIADFLRDRSTSD